jgi:uncharacterized protein
MPHISVWARHATVMLALPVVLWCATTPAKKTAGGDAPPMLVSTKARAPLWKNLSELQQYAQQGNPQACFELGGRYLEGEEVPADSARAISLFEQAAQGGVMDAHFRLGKIYHDGLGVPVDYARALTSFTVAARAGVTEAQHNIGAMLVSARGVKRDYVEGLAWLMVATKSGDPSDAEAQVRTRLAKRPADIQAAEARAGELLKDLSHATVRAALLGPPPTAPTAPAPPPPPVVATPVPKPVLSPPKMEASLPGAITLPEPTLKSPPPEKK